MGYTLYYTVISMGTHTPPPIVDSKLLMAGTLKELNAMQWGQIKRAIKSPTSRIVPNQHYSSVHSLHNRVVSLSAF